jgi:hypothetical protein
MPRPPVRPAPTGKVAEAFLKAGASNEEATIAQSISNRFKDLSSADSKRAIANQYKFLRAQVFGQSTTTRLGRPALDQAGMQRANAVMVEALATLGSLPQLEKLSKSSLKTLGIRGDLDNVAYKACVKTVTEMAHYDSDARRLAAKHGLDIVYITWEDTGRSLGSSVGRNITDFNLAVEVKDAVSGKVETHRTPILRHPNFTDKSADIKSKDFKINVGNATASPLKAMTLEAVLKEPWKLMSDPAKWPLKKGGKNQGLFVPGIDDKALLSAQAAFLPVTKEGGRATYTPQAYNYQSHFSKEHGPQPSVLTIMVTPEGASMAIAGKKDEQKFGWFGGSYGEPQYFNSNGHRAPLTAARASTLGVTDPGAFQGGGANADQADRVLIIQIPLIPAHQQEQRFMPMMMTASFDGLESAARGASDLEHAVISHGEIQGPFDETMGKGWKRDDTLPVRVTEQFAWATSNGVVTDKQMKALKKQLDDAYHGADRVGSLVVPGGAPVAVPTGPAILPISLASGIDG